MTSILKSCPFCGSEAVELVPHYMCQDEITAHVECYECEAQVYGYGDTEANAKLDAIKKWNKRYVETCKNTGDKNNPLHEVDQFVCSECGFHLEDWTEVYYDDDWGFTTEPTYYEYALEHCPHCGREVAE